MNQQLFYWIIITLLKLRFGTSPLFSDHSEMLSRFNASVGLINRMNNYEQPSLAIRQFIATDNDQHKYEYDLQLFEQLEKCAVYKLIRIGPGPLPYGTMKRLE